MCQRLYLASITPLPLAESAALTVAPLPTEAAAVRRWFSADAVHFAEALASPCGCGFPEVKPDHPARPVTPEEGRTMTALTEYLGALHGRKYVAEALLCWIGDEGIRPANRRELEVAALGTAGFRFRRSELLRFRGMPAT